MLPKTTLPSDAQTHDTPFWLAALRHFGAAVLLVGLIALAVALLSMPVQAQDRSGLRTGDPKCTSLFVLPGAQGPQNLRQAGLIFQSIQVSEAVVFGQA